MTEYQSKRTKYLSKHPNTPGTKKRVEDLGWIHPTSASRSRHSRGPRINANGNPERPLTGFELSRTIHNGELMPSRPPYQNKKESKKNPLKPSVWKTNYGIAAGVSGKTCPIMRLKSRTSTVVLSACFPREMNTDEFKPHVITSYHGEGWTYPRWSKESGEFRRQSIGFVRTQYNSNFPSLGTSSSTTSRSRVVQTLGRGACRRVPMDNLSQRFSNMKVTVNRQPSTPHTIRDGSGGRGGRGGGRGGRGGGRGRRGGGRGGPGGSNRI